MKTSAAKKSEQAARHSARTLVLEDRPVNLDGFVEEWPEKGMVAMDSEFDPQPSVRVEGGRIVEMDGVERANFDFIDQFIADKAIDVETTLKSMALPADEIGKMLVDPHVSRQEVLAVTKGLTPAKLLAVAKTLNIRRNHDGHAEDARPPHTGRSGTLHKRTRQTPCRWCAMPPKHPSAGSRKWRRRWASSVMHRSSPWRSRSAARSAPADR